MRIAPVVILLASWLWVFSGLDMGWAPIDDGTLAHMGDRINQGEVPHRDFQEQYTGGSSYLNAWALRAFGYDLLSLRYPHWLLLLPWMTALYMLARRVVEPVQAAIAASMVSVVPFFMHLAPMPSWHNLMLGAIALLFTVKFWESGSRSWLFVSGLSIGLSFLAKITASYFALAVGLVLAIRAARSGEGQERTKGRLLLVVGVVSVIGLLSGAPTFNRFVFMASPIALFAASEWSASTHLVLSEGHRLLREISVVVAGVAVPVGGYLLFLWANGSLGPAIHAIVSTPGALLAVEFDAPSLITASYLVLTGSFVVANAKVSTRWIRVTVAALSIAVVVSLYASSPWFVLLTSLATVTWLPLAVSALYLQVRLRGIDVKPALVAIVAGAVSAPLLGYPSLTQYQLFYTVPFAGIGLLALLYSHYRKYFMGALVCMAVALAVFSVGKVQGRWMTPVDDASVGYVVLEGERGGIRIPTGSAFYNDLIDTIKSTSSQSSVLISGPNSPEVYFLTGLRSPTPLVLEGTAHSFGPDAAMEAVLISGEFEFLVLNRWPHMAVPLRIDHLDWLDQIGNHYQFDVYVNRRSRNSD